MSTSDIKKFKAQSRPASSPSLSAFKSGLTASSSRPTTPPKKGVVRSAWDTFTDYITRPVAAASNLLEDTGKTIGFGISKMIDSKKTGSWSNATKNQDIDFLGHLKGTLGGSNKRTYSTVMNEMASKESSPVLSGMMKTTGYGGDVLLDPLNKVSVLGLTNKGKTALKSGSLALSAAEQADKGQRALLQIGKWNVAPQVGNKVLKGSTVLNDWIRGTKAGGKTVNALAALNTKVRPAGVARNEWNVLTRARDAARNTSTFATDKAVEFASGMERNLRQVKATPEIRSALLNAIEKGDKKLVPKGLEPLFDAGVRFKNFNSAIWNKYGGSVIEGHGLSHVATKEVADASRKSALKGGKLFSPQTPQDIHRQWVKADGKIINLGDEGISYVEGAYQPGASALKKGRIPLYQGRGGMLDKAINNVDELGAGEYFSRDASVAKKFGKTSKKSAYLQPKDILTINNRKDFQQFTTSAIKAFPDKDVSVAKNLYAKQLGYKAVEASKNFDEIGGIHIVDDSVFNAPSRSSVGGYFNKAGQPIKVEQASAHEINNWLKGQGKNPVFQEDLPTVIAKMGISTGKKKAGYEFIQATKGIKSEAGKKLVNEAYEKMSNVEAINKAIEGFDKVQNLWKAQALVAPSYHVRNMAGNLWNNYLAGVMPRDYVNASAIQKYVKSRNLGKAGKTMVSGLGNTGIDPSKIPSLIGEMEQHGVLGGGWYGKDITQAIADQITPGTWKPWKQNNILFKGNKAVGSIVEDNARIAHYLTKRRDGYTAIEAARSVKAHLFDYGDLTWAEKNVLKRLMPFYTWTSKNIPLQVEQFFNQPGKFSKIGVVKQDLEANIPKPEERWMSDYIKANAPIRIRQDKDGTTQYLLLGQWLPAASAFDILSQPLDAVVGMLTPALKLPAETLLNKSSFFKSTTGDYADLEKFPGQKKNFLGLDLGPKSINVLRSIRMLNELDKLNPGSVFGSKKKGSVWADMGFESGSRKRGSQHAPDSSQTSRVINMFVGKTSNYDPSNSKYFYDRETQDRVSEYKAEIKDAMKNKNPQRAKKVNEEMRNFLRQRNGQ